MTLAVHPKLSLASHMLSSCMIIELCPSLSYNNLSMYQWMKLHLFHVFADMKRYTKYSCASFFWDSSSNFSWDMLRGGITRLDSMSMSTMEGLPSCFFLTATAYYFTDTSTWSCRLLHSSDICFMVCISSHNHPLGVKKCCPWVFFLFIFLW